jgi:hypothetical protein
MLKRLVNCCGCPLEIPAPRRNLPAVNRNFALPVALMVVFALSRVPGMLPENFSAAYALMFCAGVYFRDRLGWWLPFATLLLTDLGLNLYYWLALGWDVWGGTSLGYLAFNYAGYAVLFLLGRRFRPGASFAGLLGGGVLGALLFYLITNTASWLFNPFHNPEYTKTLGAWLLALTKGTGGWPEAWTFFRNTLLSGGLFTALFVGTMKLTAPAESPVEKEAPEAADAPAAETEESKA